MSIRAAAHYADIILEGNKVSVLDLIRAEYKPNGERQYQVIHLPLSELESSKTLEFAKVICVAAFIELLDGHVQLTTLSLSLHSDRWLLKHVPLFMKSFHCAFDFEIRA